MSIVKNELRVGRFTSSEIYLLAAGKTGFIKSGYTYIEKKFFERKINRSLDMGKYGQSAQWGLFLERYVFSHFMGLKYEIAATETKINPELDCHAGSADLVEKGVKVGDIKCYEPLNFCRMAECFALNDVQEFKNQFPKEYWQLVSNAIIYGTDRAELILYMPNLQELQEIRDLAMDHEGSDQWKFRFITENEDYQLPYVPDEAAYENLNRFEFEVPQVDKDFLIDRIKEADKIIKERLK